MKNKKNIIKKRVERVYSVSIFIVIASCRKNLYTPIKEMHTKNHNIELYENAHCLDKSKLLNAALWKY